jgi:hypothetical protein
VNENLALAMGRPVVAFPEQDHLAHLQVLLEFMASPALGMNPIIAPVFLPAALQHAKEHILYYYVETATVVIKQAAGREAHLLMSADDQVKKKLDQLLAVVSSFVVPKVASQVQANAQILQQAMQMVQQLAPKPPIDPAIAATLQATQAETQRKAAADQANNQIAQAKLNIAAQQDQTRSDIADATNQTRVATTQLDNQTAIEIASNKIASGQPTGLQNGESFRGGA